ncbi:erg10, acetyl-CoA C-acetyltransferase [Coemansia sp. RSA 1290]|nr:erg10, acetyl-CoA C-acetyltransferase [Coemansia sp. RSA 1290]KAJ2651363.1 erg10, acetyl-CoA C-acetyltransferase [Coemansia sp. RSA 1250]
MFSHVHAYAEHATRTRPNMNDVARALEERMTSVSQLDAYYQKEKQTISAVKPQDIFGDKTADKPPEQAPFTDTRAEELLCKLVEFHKARVEKQKAQGSSDSAIHDDDEDGEDFEAPELGDMPAEDPSNKANVAHSLEDEPQVAGQKLESPNEQAELKQAPVDTIENMLLPSSVLPDYIPAQCPPFPSPHTYKQTPVFPKREQDFFRTRMHKAEQSRQAEENLQRLISGPQFDRSTLVSTANNGSVNGSPVETAQAMAVDQQATAKRNACKRILQLFPPANFRDISKHAYIVGAARTAVGNFGGALSKLSAIQLGSIALKGALEKSKVSAKDVDEIYFGNVMSANLGQNPARQVALGAGCVADKIVGTTVNKVCASGMKAISLAAQSIRLGEAQVAVAVGAESMSNVPYYIPAARFGAKFGAQKIVDGVENDGLLDAYSQTAMGYAAEATAAEFGVTREEQDEFAIASYQKAVDAAAAGKFANEIVPVEVPQGRGKPALVVSADEEPAKFNAEKLRKLRPAFPAADGTGTVTAGNASSLSDGAAAVVLVSGAWLQKLADSGVIDIARDSVYRVAASADAEQSPERFTTSPAPAVIKALSRATGGESDKSTASMRDFVDYVELNEAFSVVGIANTKLIDFPADRVNVNGGAVGIGHPLGCSGARIVVALCTILAQNNARRGAAGVCNGGGGASAIIIERI